MNRALTGGDVEAQRRRVVTAGHRGDVAAARRSLSSADGSIRAAALGALARAGGLGEGDLLDALADGDATVRRRATELAARRPPGEPLRSALVGALDDADPLVVDGACWALGERREPGVAAALAAVSAGHPDTRAREAAVAALGAIGEPGTLDAVLAALSDKPTVRRRAVVALAAFDGPAVTDALRRAAADRDWQVREVAEILLAE